MIYFEQLGKYLSQLVLLLKSLRDGAEDAAGEKKNQ